MTSKKDLIKYLKSKIPELKQNDIVEYSVEHTINYIKASLKQKNRIEVRGFGSLTIRSRKFAGKEKFYNTIYYRSSGNILAKINQENN